MGSGEGWELLCSSCMEAKRSQFLKNWSFEWLSLVSVLSTWSFSASSWDFEIFAGFIFIEILFSNAEEWRHVDKTQLPCWESWEATPCFCHWKGLLQPSSSKTIFFLVHLYHCGSTVQCSPVKFGFLFIAWIIHGCSPHLQEIGNKPAFSGYAGPYLL